MSLSSRVPGRRPVLRTLGFLLLLLQAAAARSFWKQALREGRAEESHDEPHADQCPPPPQSLPEGACQAERCQADAECPRPQGCCYNGCVFTCLETVPDPPVIDWLVQPKPRFPGGNGWLVDGPEVALPVLVCSTTEDGDEPLRCPSGYECHILSPGDAAQGVPNRGQCVQQQQPDAGEQSWETLDRAPEDVSDRARGPRGPT
ncbi:WAP four-disulfide core domain protein 1 isoform X1 [Sorex araneus]|uniref:WAP four-disulfide core domain protein 1 isoform X1 n=1 Tax=Sorex araneus TaxID=42254 RepID=UPI002433CFAE|nr:WAP four-disulfide core domain protein 1 isoform X1 [Sorex araneus]